MQALSVAHVWDAQDEVIEYLKTGDESLRDEAINKSAIACGELWAYRTPYVHGKATAETKMLAATATAWAASRSVNPKDAAYGAIDIANRVLKLHDY